MAGQGEEPIVMEMKIIRQPKHHFHSIKSIFYYLKGQLFWRRSVRESYWYLFNTLDMIYRDVMDQLVDSGRVSGVLLAADLAQTRPDAMSPDLTCPNRYSSLDDSCDDAAPWNPLGAGFLRRDWPIAMYLSKDPAVLKSIRDVSSSGMHSRVFFYPLRLVLKILILGLVLRIKLKNSLSTKKQ